MIFFTLNCEVRRLQFTIIVDRLSPVNCGTLGLKKTET